MQSASIFCCIHACTSGTALANPIPPLAHCILGLCLGGRRPTLPLQYRIVDEIPLTNVDHITQTYVTFLHNSRSDGEVMLPLESSLGCFLRVDLHTKAHRTVVSTDSDLQRPTCVLSIPVFGAANSPPLVVVSSWNKPNLWLMNADTGDVLWTLCEADVRERRFTNPCDLCLVPLPEGEAPIKLPAHKSFPSSASCEVRHLIGTTLRSGEIVLIQPFADDAPFRLRVKAPNQLPGLSYLPNRRCIVAMDSFPFICDVSHFLMGSTGDIAGVKQSEDRVTESIASGITWLDDATFLATPWTRAPPVLATLLEDGRIAHQPLPEHLCVRAAGCCVDNRGNIVLLDCDSRKLIVFR